MLKNNIYLIIYALFFSINSYAEVLNICQRSPFVAFDPTVESSVATENIYLYKIYEPLVKFPPKHKQALPLLITHWKNNSTYDKWTLYLQKKIPFHETSYFKPTRYLNADDVIFSLKKYSADSSIKEVKKINESQVQIQLVRADQNFLKKLSSINYVIYSKEYFDKLSNEKKLDNFFTMPVGTGPFSIEKQDKTRLHLSYFKNYHLGRLHFNQLDFYHAGSLGQVLSLSKQGLCDIITEIYPWELDDFAQLENFNLQFYRPVEYYALELNYHKSPLNSMIYRRWLVSLISGQNLQEKFIGKLAAQHFYQKRFFVNNLEAKIKHPKTVLKLVIPKEFKPAQIFQKKLVNQLKLALRPEGIKLQTYFKSDTEIKKIIVANEQDLLLTRTTRAKLEEIEICPKETFCSSSFSFDETEIAKQVLKHKKKWPSWRFYATNEILFSWPYAAGISKRVKNFTIQSKTHDYFLLYKDKATKTR